MLGIVFDLHLDGSALSTDAQCKWNLSNNYIDWRTDWAVSWLMRVHLWMWVHPSAAVVAVGSFVLVVEDGPWCRIQGIRFPFLFVLLGIHPLFVHVTASRRSGNHGQCQDHIILLRKVNDDVYEDCRCRCSFSCGWMQPTVLWYCCLILQRNLKSKGKGTNRYIVACPQRADLSSTLRCWKMNVMHRSIYYALSILLL